MRRWRFLFTAAAVLSTLLCTKTAANAVPTVLYNNNQPNTTDFPTGYVACNGWTVNFGFAVSDQFRLTACSDVNGFRATFWQEPGEHLCHINYTIRQDNGCPCCKACVGGKAFSAPIADGGSAHGTVTAIPDTCAATCGFTPFDNTFGFTMEEYSFGLGCGFDLAPGAYFLQLCCASTCDVAPIYWCESHQKCPDGCGCIHCSNNEGVAVCNAGIVRPPTSGTFAFENSEGRIGSQGFQITGQAGAAPEIDPSNATAPLAIVLSLLAIATDRRIRRTRS